MTETVPAPGPRRLDVQILRAIAVLGVMLAHFGALVPGGFLGVDVFFVISGFVITLSVVKLSAQSSGRRNFLLTFWRRRFFRLFPVLSVVIAATLIVTVFALPPVDFLQQVKMSLWSLAFAGNVGVEVLSRADYFDPAAEENWFLHLWSLGVEEQFYLVFPFIFLAVIASAWGRGQLRRQLVTVGGIAIVSFVLATLNDFEASLGQNDSVFSSTGVGAILGFYSPVTRAWQFLVGVIAALIALRGLSRSRPLVTALGFVGLAIAFVVTPPSNQLPGVITLLPVISVFFILISPLNQVVASSRALAPLRWLGDRSYGAYLWHWPVWLTAKHILGATPLAIALSIGVTVVLSALSYRLVEQPFISSAAAVSFGMDRQNMKRRWTGSAPRVAAVLLPLPLLVGLAPVAANQWFEAGGLLIRPDSVPRIEPDADCLETGCEEQDIDVLVVGDSHAGALYSALSQELASHGLTVRGAILARTVGCLHLPSTTVVSPHEECQELSASVRTLISHAQPDFVVIHGYTTGRFTEINSGGDSEIQLVFSETGTAVTQLTALDSYELALGETLDIIAASGSRAIVISGVPDFSSRPQEILAPNKPASQAELLLAPWSDFRFGETLNRDDLADRHDPFRAVERALVDSRQTVTLIDPWVYLCEPDECSQTSEDGSFLFADQDHVSDLGAGILASGIVSELFRDGLID